MRTSVISSAVLAGVVAFSTSACGGSSPAPGPITESSLSASPSPSGAPSMPVEAKGTDKAAAKAFVEYYLSVLSYATTTGDTAIMSELGLPDCSTCQKLKTQVDEVYAAGGKASGKGYAAPELRQSQAASSGDRIELRGDVTQFAQTFQATANDPVQNFPRGSFKSVFTVVRNGDDWRMMTWERL